MLKYTQNCLNPTLVSFKAFGLQKSQTEQKKLHGSLSRGWAGVAVVLCVNDWIPPNSASEGFVWASHTAGEACAAGTHKYTTQQNFPTFSLVQTQLTSVILSII